MAKKTEGVLARNLSRWMRERKLTYRDVAAMSVQVSDPIVGEIDQTTVHRIASGVTKSPRVLILQAICDVFGKSIDEAVGHEVLDPIERSPRRNRRRRA